MRKYTDLGLLILRVSASVLMMIHGYSKIKMLQAGDSKSFSPALLGENSGTISLILAIIGEFVAPIFIIVGFKTRIAALPAIVTMGVAAFYVHAGAPIADREKALLYFFIFICFLFNGAGKFSIDGLKK